MDIFIAWLGAATPTPNVPPQVGQTAWDIAQQVLVFLVGVATLYGLLIRPAAKRVSRWARDTVATIAAQQAATSQQIEQVAGQVRPNGGQSAHDYARKAYEVGKANRAAVSELHNAVRNQGLRTDQMQGDLTSMGWRVNTLAGAISAAGISVTDEREQT